MTPENQSFAHVMVIDDNTIDLYISSRVIQSCGFGKNVLSYTSAVDALDYLRENAENPALLPQIIIVDIYMPIMSGFEFLERYQALPRTVKENATVYVVSSTIDNDDISRIHADKNVASFHEKPISKAFLQSILQTMGRL